MAPIFSPKKPETKPVTAMPDEGDPAIMAADQRRRQQMMGRSGRRSTLLTGAGDTLMGSGSMSEFSKDKIG